jgi:hypothetical protein
MKENFKAHSPLIFLWDLELSGVKQTKKQYPNNNVEEKMD